MIYVDYEYYSVSEKTWKEGTTEFGSVYKAERFIRKVKNDKYMYLVGWRCDDPEDNEYLNRRGL